MAERLDVDARVGGLDASRENEGTLRVPRGCHEAAARVLRGCHDKKRAPAMRDALVGA